MGRSEQSRTFFHCLVGIKSRASTSRSDSKGTFANYPFKSIKKGSSKNNQFRSWKRIMDEGKTREKSLSLFTRWAWSPSPLKLIDQLWLKLFPHLPFFYLSVLPILHFQQKFMEKHNLLIWKFVLFIFYPRKIETFVWRWRVSRLIKSINLNQYGCKRISI